MQKPLNGSHQLVFQDRLFNDSDGLSISAGVDPQVQDGICGVECSTGVNKILYILNIYTKVCINKGPDSAR